MIIKASGAEASNSSSILTKVLECEPGKVECNGATLLACSEDGMMLNRTSCDYLCEDGKCKKYVNIAMNKNESQVSPVLESSMQHFSWLEAAAVVAVLVVLMVFVLLKL